MRLIILTALFITQQALGQNKLLTHDDFDSWKNIKKTSITPNGNFIVYEVKPGLGEGSLHITSKNGTELIKIPRGEGSLVSWDSKYVVFKIKPQFEEIRALKRSKTKESKLPKDSLGIYNLTDKTLEKIARVRAFDMPQESSNMLAYYLEEPLEEKKEKNPNDSTEKKPTPKISKKVSKENGYHLVIRKLDTGNQDTISYVTDHKLAKRSNNFIYHTSGRDSTIHEGVYRYTFEDGNQAALCRGKGKFKQLAVAYDGLQMAFVADLDTTKALIRDFELRYWNAGKDSAVVIAKKTTPGLANEWLVSEYGNVYFSENGTRLFFGSNPAPIVQDTTLLPDEIIQVEVWNYKNVRLHTQQNIEKDGDLKKSFLAYFDTMNEKIYQIGNEQVPNITLADHGNADHALGVSNLPYQKYISWEGFPMRNDIYSVDLSTGRAKLAARDLRGNAGISAMGNYLYWYNAEDSIWSSYANDSGEIFHLTSDINTSMADEENDQPNYPYPYGIGGWTEGDNALLIYDRFDIWKVSPENKSKPLNITNGRSEEMEYRVMDLNPKKSAIDTDIMILHTFSETTKNEGYALMKNLASPKQMLNESAKFTNLKKAENGNTLTFQKGNHQTYYDLQATDLNLKKVAQVSNVNPQQKDYAWGSVELVSWTSLDGEKLSGKLYKPADFDRNKKYPMIVNFYETHSDDLHRHWGVFPHRSTVNAAFYANQGYLVFNPDVKYKIGYPGESAYNCVVSGTTYLIDQGFVNEKKIGLQGHSWGGYQIAYLITKTDLFACAEAGAVVSNMISAYGGIRWWTGLSRMFQYEHTQSRIGGTLWEYPTRFIENSPIFYADKVNTPLLMMHNDADGHVPWYQGIEYYVALRRLNKPVWMLNYKGEPHWPTKWENIRDFNIRMNQFFDHYLKDAPMPEWMAEGVPSTEVGINKGLNLVEE